MVLKGLIRKFSINYFVDSCCVATEYGIIIFDNLEKSSTTRVDVIDQIEQSGYSVFAAFPMWPGYSEAYIRLV